MTTLMALYEKPADQAAFDRYYKDNHLPLVRKLPGLKSVALSKPGLEVLSDAKHYLVARMEFGSVDQAKAALESAEGVAAANDLANFADGGVQLVLFDEVVHVI
jgi:uncharacterized protein (TIGR02118 family)